MGIINEVSTWNYSRKNVEYNKMREYDMLLEELIEFHEATTDVDQADALADIIFVAIGSLYKMTGNSYKVEAIMAEVIKANFKKGASTDENGKIVKPGGFVGPEIGIDYILNNSWSTYLNKNGHIYE